MQIEKESKKNQQQQHIEDGRKRCLAAFDKYHLTFFALYALSIE